MGKTIEEIAKELVSVLPETGGIKEGMYHDIVHAMREYNKQTLDRLETESLLVQELQRLIDNNQKGQP